MCDSSTVAPSGLSWILRIFGHLLPHGGLRCGQQKMFAPTWRRNVRWKHLMPFASRRAIYLEIFRNAALRSMPHLPRGRFRLNPDPFTPNPNPLVPAVLRAAGTHGEPVPGTGPLQRRQVARLRAARQPAGLAAGQQHHPLLQHRSSCMHNMSSVSNQSKSRWSKEAIFLRQPLIYIPSEYMCTFKKRDAHNCLYLLGNCIWGIS